MFFWAFLAVWTVPAVIRAEPLPSPRNLDGLVVTFGPVGAAVRQDGVWDGAFGGEIGVFRVREASALSVVGIATGGFWFSERTGGRATAELFVASRWLGVPIGLAAGPSVELDRVRTPRWGGHLSLWAYFGVVPFVRVGHLQDTGRFVDVGLRIPLPTWRWPND